MRLWVSVPVLSVRITFVAPSVSTADRRFTSALRSAIRFAPRASVRVAITGRPSGTVATARAMAVCTIANQCWPVASP